MAYINGQKVLFSPRINISGNESGSDAILSVSSLPTENISTKHFYRTSDGMYWWDGKSWNAVNDVKINAGDVVGEVTAINTWSGYTHNLRANGYGISWQDDFNMSNHDGDNIAGGIIDQHIPLVAGENVTFSDDEIHPIVKINVPLDNISYDKLVNRPFGEGMGEPIEVTLTVDSLEDGHRVSFNHDEFTWLTWEAVQVSKISYTREQLLGGEVLGASDLHTIATSNIVEYTEDGLKLLFNEGIPCYIFVAYTTNYQPEGFDAPLPAVGVYFSYAYDNYESRGTQQLWFGYRSNKKLDNKFLDLLNNNDFKALAKKVEEGTTDIVVPAQGSRGNENFVEGIPGLVKLYNESAGLNIDAYGQLGVVSATEEEITKGESLRKPITPKRMKYAMQQNSFTGDLNNISSTSDDAKTPVGAFAVKHFLLQNMLNFKLYKIPREGMFEIKPGMMAVILPYGDYTLSLHESRSSSAKVSSMGATVITATDWGADSEDPQCFWVSVMHAKSYKVLGVDIPTMASNHTKYTSNCYIKNNDSGTSGTGYAYVYYLSRD